MLYNIELSNQEEQLPFLDPSEKARVHVAKLVEPSRILEQAELALAGQC